MTSLPLLPLVLDQVPLGLRLALAQDGIPAVEHAADPHAGRYVLYDSRAARGTEFIPFPSTADQRNEFRSTPGQTRIDIHALRHGHRDDPFERLLDERSARHRWRIGPVEASEEIAAVDKRALRKTLLHGLRSLVEAAGGIWLRVGAFPFPYRSAFNFRLDHDAYDRADMAAVLRAMTGHEAAFSHYVCGSTHAAHPEALAALRGMDVGSHGYWHHTYRDRPSNLRNLQRGIEVLRGAGIEPSGFVAPHGRFNRGLLAAMQELGVSHSSEFALGYDDLPFFPPESSVLQIPVYPVCLGICLEAWRKSRHKRLNPAPLVEALAGHLQRVAEARYQAGEPIFLYGHPDGRLGRYPQVILRVLETIECLGDVWQVDRTTFARWWRQRAGAQVRVEQDADTFIIRAGQLPAGHRLSVEYWRGEHVAVMPVDEPMVRFAPAALAFQRRGTVETPRAVRIDRAEGLRGTVRRMLDWERVTPIEEINTSTLRGWLKQTLRRVRK